MKGKLFVSLSLPLFFLIIFQLGACSSTNSTNSSKPNNNTEEALIIITTQGSSVSLTPEDLKIKFKMTEFEVVANPAYKGTRKKYQGFDFATLLRSLDDQFDHNRKRIQIEVTTLDGWKAPVYSAEKLSKGQAFLALYESAETLSEPISDDKKWSLVVTPKKTIYPGPYYLVWNDREKNPDVLPFQVKTIKLTTF